MQLLQRLNYGLIALISVIALLLKNAGIVSSEALIVFSIALTVYYFANQKASVDAFAPRQLLVIAYIVFLLLGALLFEILQTKIIDSDVQDYIFTGYISLIIGFALAALLFSGGKTIYAPIPCKSLSIIHWLLALAFASYLILVAKNGIPLFSANPDAARLAFFAGNGHISVFFLGAPIFSLALLVDAVALESKKRLLISHIIVAVTFILNALMGARGASLSILISYVFVYLLLRRGGLILYWSLF